MLDPALRRVGRFDREIEIGVPNIPSRKDILCAHLERYPNSVSNACLEDVALHTHGFVGADLMSVTKIAAWNAYGREGVPCIQDSDLREASQKVKPSCLRSVSIEIPNVRWDDIGGQEVTKERLREAVEYPITKRHVFERLGIRPPRGILLYGPPGCGKTLLAKAVATESSYNFITVKGPELLSAWVGESERASARSVSKSPLGGPDSYIF